MVGFAEWAPLGLEGGHLTLVNAFDVSQDKPLRDMVQLMCVGCTVVGPSPKTN